MVNFSFFKETHFSFEGKRDDETVVLALNRHWYTLGNKIFIIALGALLPLLVLALFGQMIIAYNLIGAFAVLWAGYYMFLWYSLFYALTMYSLDTWIVTDQRIVDRTQQGFFNQSVAELSIGNIQDVSFKMNGAIATMMNYGYVDIQTAGVARKFLFEQVPNPEQIKDVIMDLVSKNRAAKNQSTN